MPSSDAPHATLGELRVDEAVATEGTNWTFIGKPTHPSWENTHTDHRLLITPAESQFTYRVQLNHENQLRPFWTVTELDFAPELIPLVEWILSAPDDVLHNREAVCYLIEPFWTQQDGQQDRPSRNTY